MSSDDDALLVEQDGGVLTLTNVDPPRNRMTFAYMNALEEAVNRAATDPSVRAIVFTAAGDEHFSVGMDLKQLVSAGNEHGAFDEILDQRRRVLGMIESMEKPSIATLFGYCLGGGLELPLACHFRLAADHGARIGLPELDLGTVPAWGGTARLTRTVGRANALDMMLRVRKIDGMQALDIGLVHEVHPMDELKSAARALAEELAALPPVAVAGVLRCVVGAGDAPLEEALDIEREAVNACNGTEDLIEGMQAFMQKRKPVFRGR
ncbi:MAG: enoyl-CoA hydratase/isomerase family protein [Actinomycetia bacterium]|nr:enoyl-CoA hydratase/isomerase family protein [Actinomycetes bacterium]